MKVRKLFRWMFIVTLMITVSLKVTEMPFWDTWGHVAAQGPTMSKQYTLQTATTSGVTGVFGNGLGLWRAAWQPVGNNNATTCVATLQKSIDNSTWTTLISIPDCSTANGSVVVPDSAVGYIRFNISSLTLGSATGITLRWDGYGIIRTDQGGYISSPQTRVCGLGGTACTTAIDTTIKTGAGVLHSFIVTGPSSNGATAAATTHSVSCFDATAGGGAGTNIMPTSWGGTQGSIILDVAFATGLTCTTTGFGGTSSWMIAYR